MAPKPTPPTLVLLVRHGLTPTTGTKLPGRAPGLHLSEAGQDQAETVARRIAPLGDVAAVYASPLERARETAAPIAKATGNRVRTLADLHECDFGEWTGKRLADLYKKKEWKQVQRNPSGFRFPKGESFSEMQLRITDARVFWPTSSSPLYRLTGTFPFPSSDHRLVWVDTRL